MKIGEHEVKFADSLPANPWWDLWPELNDVETDEEGRFAPAKVWRWDLLERFLDAAIESWDGEPLGNPGDIPTYLVNAVSLAAYNHVTELFLKGQRQLETVSD